MHFDYSDKVKALQKRVSDFMDEHVYSNEETFLRQINEGDRWQPTRIVEEAVRGMLPKTKMGEAMWRKLKVYAGADHPHASQRPQAASLGMKPKKIKSEVA